MAEAVYLDSCIFIEILQKSDPARYLACERLNERAAEGELTIVTSAITLVEVNKLADSKALPAEQSQLILDYFENPYIVVRAVDRRTAERAHALTRTHSLTALDAIHVATALIAGVSVMYTYDAAQRKRKGLLRHDGTIGTPPLSIQQPPLQ
jgi:predicted nucleic acid-binding protein